MNVSCGMSSNYKPIALLGFNSGNRIACVSHVNINQDGTVLIEGIGLTTGETATATASIICAKK